MCGSARDVQTQLCGACRRDLRASALAKTEPAPPEAGQAECTMCGGGCNEEDLVLQLSGLRVCPGCRERRTA